MIMARVAADDARVAAKIADLMDRPGIYLSIHLSDNIMRECQ